MAADLADTSHNEFDELGGSAAAAVDVETGHAVVKSKLKRKKKKVTVAPDAPRSSLERDNDSSVSTASPSSENEQRDHHNNIPFSTELLLIGCVLAIYVCYFIYSILQERITKTRWGRKQEKFSFTLCMLLVQCSVNALIAFLTQLVFALPRNRIPPQKYVTVSVTYISAMYFSNHALNFVSYPTQVFAKSCKPMPVMMVSKFLFGRHYPPLRYTFILMMCIGIAMYSFDTSKLRDGDVTSNTGLLLLLISLALDGITGPFQEQLFEQQSPTPNQLMLYSNIWAIAILAPGALLTGELFEAVNFCVRHPPLVADLAMFAVCSALGQNFIFYCVSKFGALVLSTVTTSRKFFTILFSAALYGHRLSGLQVLGVIFVFAALGGDIIFNYWMRQRTKRQTFKMKRATHISEEAVLA